MHEDTRKAERAQRTQKGCQRDRQAVSSAKCVFYATARCRYAKRQAGHTEDKGGETTEMKQTKPAAIRGARAQREGHRVIVITQTNILRDVACRKPLAKPSAPSARRKGPSATGNLSHQPNVCFMQRRGVGTPNGRLVTLKTKEEKQQKWKPSPRP